MKVLIIDNYDSFTFNLFQMLQPLVEEEIAVYRNDQIDFAGVQALKPDKIVLSPGPGHPANAGDFGVCGPIIGRQSELQCAILGVCLGHQGMVHQLGGHVIRAPQIVHGKSSQIDIIGESPLFDGVPATFEAMRYHSLVAAEDGFPPELKIIAREKKHALIMALQHRAKPMYGVQFHPESIGTAVGQTILRNFIEKC